MSSWGHIGNGGLAVHGLRNLSMIAKLTAVAAVAVLAVVAVAWAQLASLRPDLLATREKTTRDIVQAASSIVAGYVQRAEPTPADTARQQAAALAALKDLRYDGQQYVWVNDMNPTMLMHPIKPDMDGTDLAATTDSNGTHLFVEFVNTVRTQGSGFVTYLWPKPGADQPVPKLSYVQGVPAWGWVIGTGLYLDDVDAAVSAAQWGIIGRTALIMILLLGLVFLVSRSVTRPLRVLTSALDGLAAGNEDVELPPDSKDEIGRCVASARVLRDGLIAQHTLGRENEALQVQAAADRRRTAEALSLRLRETVDGAMERIHARVDSLAGASDDLAGGADRLVGSVAAIGDQAAEATDAATRAAGDADVVVDTVAGLSAAADRIGGVVDVIRKVAFQTNLLALNATIEAARAGSAGKGFAVVAHEVQELSQQSSRASDRIAGQVREIQDSTGAAATALTRIAGTVRGLGQATSSVSASLDGTHAATGTTRDVGVRAEVSANRLVADRVSTAANQLAVETGQLRQEVEELAAELVR